MYYIHQLFKCLSILGLISNLVACSSLLGGKHGYYVVKKGDTLYAVARKHKIKLDHLAKINNINTSTSTPVMIRPGQKLMVNIIKFNSDQTKKAKPSVISNNWLFREKQKKQNKQNIKQDNLELRKSTTNKLTIKKDHNQPIAVKSSNLVEVSNDVAAIDKARVSNAWIWPAKGKIIKYFNKTGITKGNGIDLAGNRGDPILSAANGKVVYSGNGLRGYGNLIIIKHDQDFLSAYAHNQKILVKEQQVVTKGQQIATMGDSEATQVVLHFEIRYKGKPIDPLKILHKVH